MHYDIETGSIFVAIVSMFILGFGLWLIKKIGEL